ncbi:MAG TPA: serine/threonine-protein kinase [Nakamurella sp.]
MPPAARTPAPGLPPGGRTLAGRYRLESVIGKGSMGTVWAATDEVLHRRVAIKEIDFPPGMPPGEVQQLHKRTLREARAVAALSNPYVITLFDILTLHTGPVIVMELLHARSLAEVIKQVGRLPDGQAATIGVAVASGLLAAHAAGITHRDVKPGNVLICDDGRIKLTDFGIARSSGEQTMTATGLLLGSPAYIAPEVANGVPAGPISDAWGLGGMLFACVEGRPPFDQGTAIATLTSVVKDPVPPHPHSGRLGAVISGLLVKTPQLRMRIDRSLTVMRGIADDPSGTHLALIARVPRTSPGGTIGTPSYSASISPGQSPAISPGQAPHSGPPTTQPSVPSAPNSPGWGERPPQQTGRPQAPSGPGPQGWAPPPPSSRSASVSASVSAQRMSPYTVHPSPPLPPPPWAQDAAASLAPLPETAPTESHRTRILLAVLVALIAAAAGFFGVRLIADAAGSGSAGALSVQGSAGPGDITGPLWSATRSTST